MSRRKKNKAIKIVSNTPVDTAVKALLWTDLTPQTKAFVEAYTKGMLECYTLPTDVRKQIYRIYTSSDAFSQYGVTGSERLAVLGEHPRSHIERYINFFAHRRKPDVAQKASECVTKLPEDATKDFFFDNTSHMGLLGVVRNMGYYQRGANADEIGESVGRFLHNVIQFDAAEDLLTMRVSEAEGTRYIAIVCFSKPDIEEIVTTGDTHVYETSLTRVYFVRLCDGYPDFNYTTIVDIYGVPLDYTLQGVEREGEAHSITLIDNQICQVIQTGHDYWHRLNFNEVADEDDAGFNSFTMLEKTTQGDFTFIVRSLTYEEYDEAVIEYITTASLVTAFIEKSRDLLAVNISTFDKAHSTLRRNGASETAQILSNTPIPSNGEDVVLVGVVYAGQQELVESFENGKQRQNTSQSKRKDNGENARKSPRGHMVRGHFRMQAVGKNWSERRLIYVPAFAKGELAERLNPIRDLVFKDS